MLVSVSQTFTCEIRTGGSLCVRSSAVVTSSYRYFAIFSADGFTVVNGSRSLMNWWSSRSQTARTFLFKSTKSTNRPIRFSLFAFNCYLNPIVVAVNVLALSFVFAQ